MCLVKHPKLTMSLTVCKYYEILLKNKNFPIKNAWKNQKEIPSKTKESIAMSRDLKNGI